MLRPPQGDRAVHIRRRGTARVRTFLALPIDVLLKIDDLSLAVMTPRRCI
jgi:hypothetical protein